MKAKDIKDILEYELGDWNDSAHISEDEKTITITVAAHRECSDDPFAYEYKFEMDGDFWCTAQGGSRRNWGTPYNAGIDTLEKVR